jgi:putative two-component system response regulator
VDQKTIVDIISRSAADFIDGQTGLCREGCLHCALDRELIRVHRTGEPITFGVLIVDSFSAYAERVGPAGAAALTRELSLLIKNTLREVDLASCCAPDLFGIILSRTPGALASIAGERIRQAVGKKFNGDLTVSLGLASYPVDGLSKDDMISKAVDALITAAASGGNQVSTIERSSRPADTRASLILVVDDDPQNLKLMRAQISHMGYTVLTAPGGEQALTMVQGGEVDLVLLDVMMPGMNGFEVCRQIKSKESSRLIPVILLTALEEHESKVKGIEAGADDFITKPANREELFARTKSLIGVKKLNRNLISLENALISLANAVEAKDNYTLGHTQRVSTIAVSLGRKLGLNDGELQALRLGGILHDVGKIGVAEAVLNKPGQLNEEEWKVMKGHAEMGYKICLPLLESIGPALDIIRHHHERLDGSAYPDGLRGESITIMARIMGVVDCYDAMVTNRPYRTAIAKETALAILRDESQKGKLDGTVVDALAELVAK